MEEMKRRLNKRPRGERETDKDTPWQHHCHLHFPLLGHKKIVSKRNNKKLAPVCWFLAIQWINYCTYVSSFIFTILMTQVLLFPSQRPRPEKVQILAQSHTTNMWQCKDSNILWLDQKSILICQYLLLSFSHL